MARYAGLQTFPFQCILTWCERIPKTCLGGRCAVLATIIQSALGVELVLLAGLWLFGER
jgi:hypothetical protein